MTKELARWERVWMQLALYSMMSGSWEEFEVEFDRLTDSLEIWEQVLIRDKMQEFERQAKEEEYG